MKFGKLLDELSAVERDLHRMNLYGAKMGFGAIPADIDLDEFVDFDLDRPDRTNTVKLINSFIKLKACEYVLWGPYPSEDDEDDGTNEAPIIDMVKEFAEIEWEKFDKINTPPRKINAQYVRSLIRKIKKLATSVSETYDNDTLNQFITEREIINLLTIMHEPKRNILRLSRE